MSIKPNYQKDSEVVAAFGVQGPDRAADPGGRQPERGSSRGDPRISAPQGAHVRRSRDRAWPGAARQLVSGAFETLQLPGPQLRRRRGPVFARTRRRLPALQHRRGILPFGSFRACDRPALAGQECVCRHRSARAGRGHIFRRQSGAFVRANGRSDASCRRQPEKAQACLALRRRSEDRGAGRGADPWRRRTAAGHPRYRAGPVAPHRRRNARRIRRSC